MIAISSLRYVEKVDLMTTVAQRVPRSRRPKQQALIDEARKRQRGGSGRRFAIAVVTIAAAVGIAYGITRATLTSAPSAAIRLPNPCLLLPTKEVEQILRVNVGVVTRLPAALTSSVSACGLGRGCMATQNLQAWRCGSRARPSPLSFATRPSPMGTSKFEALAPAPSLHPTGQEAQSRSGSMATRS